MREELDKELDRLLSAKLDGDLTPAGARRLAELLAADRQAEEEARRLERVDRLVRAWGATRPASADWATFRAGVMERVAAEKRRRDRRAVVYRFASFAAPLAAAAVIVMAFTLRWRGLGEPELPAPLHGQPSIQVAYVRPAAPSNGSEGRIVVEFARSEELERAIAAQDAASEGAPSLAVASRGNAAIPVSAILSQLPL